MPPPRPASVARRRRLRAAALSIAVVAAAAGLSVLIAWWQEWRFQRSATPPPAAATFNSRYAPSIAAVWGDPWSLAQDTPVEALNIVAVEPEKRGHVSTWLANREPPAWLPAPRDDAPFLQTVASGWPFRCMRRSIRKDGQREQTLSLPAAALHLPTGIHSPGFAADTAFFACSIALLVIAPIAAFRTLRARRLRREWRCTGCGYPMGYGPLDAACPECGAARSGADR